MKATAKAPANIAFIKYWGKTNEALRLPANSSLSMNLSNAFTVTSVEFGKQFKTDIVFMNGKKIDGGEALRISQHLNKIRKLAHMNLKAKVETENNFPKNAGIASSASGFAALTVAGSVAAGLKLSEKELSILARVGSGSACRSIPDGFVEWKQGNSSETSFAYSLYPADYWDIRDLIIVVGSASKKVGSSEGHALAESSPFYVARIKDMSQKVVEIKKALGQKDFTKFGEILEAEAINMHAVMMTSNPPLLYWNPMTIEIINSVWKLRDSGVEVYFTIDAGPNIHLICQAKDMIKINTTLKKLPSVKFTIVNHPCEGTRLIS